MKQKIKRVPVSGTLDGVSLSKLTVPGKGPRRRRREGDVNKIRKERYRGWASGLRRTQICSSPVE